jgi:predicted MFS family arabinose efflux permease
VILAGCLIATITFGARTTFGLFIEPLSVLRGWDRESFALAIAIQNLLWGAGQPFAGAIADRHGAARVLAAGGAVYALGTALMAVSTSPGAIAMTGGVLVGLGLTGGSFTIVIAAFARLVDEERRTWAIGLATAAASLGQFLFAPLGQAFISSYGPATALVLLAGCVAVVPLLATALSAPGSRTAEPDASPVSVARALRTALSHPSYLLLTAGFFVCGFHIAFISTHLPPYLGDLGFGTALAAWAIGLIGLFNVIGAYSSGILSGIHPKRLVLSGIYFARAVAFALFLAFEPTQLTVLLFAAAIGLLWLSTVPPTSGLVALMFGTRHVGLLFGVVFLSHQVGAFAGVWLGGAVYERTGGYTPMWWICIALSMFAAFVHLPIVERRAPRWPVATA